MPKFKCKIPFYKDDVENVVKTKTIEADNEVDAKLKWIECFGSEIENLIPVKAL